MTEILVRPLTLTPVRYISTRDRVEAVDFREALVDGLAPDGGLYIPETIPGLPGDWRSWSYVDSVAGVLELFGAGPSQDLVTEAATRFDHPDIAALVPVGGRMVFELFHGPTLSFKDHALQVLARLLAREAATGVVLGATSGDTGSAAIEACRGILPIVILHPEGRISDLQRRQMTTVTEDGVVVVAVRGTFDDCQALVKNAFASMDGLLAINSINWARIAAQTGYYLSLATRMDGPFDVVVPTGNFGNAYSCWMAKQMGAPIEGIAVATNANRYLVDFFAGGAATPGEVVATSAPAMDIQVPSNLERLPAGARGEFSAGAVDDSAIEATIREVYSEHAYILDPHTATAWKVATESPTERPQVVVATAHPAKFPEVVQSAIGITPEIPDRLAGLSHLPERYLTIDPNPSSLAGIIRSLF